MDNTFRCKLINYQRIRTASLEFIPGLNVIVGESNNGKTAVLRGLETAIYNIPREEHVTLGETKSAVGIKYNDHEVIWRRDTEKTSQVMYRLDGKIYQKLGRGQPKEVADALGIAELEINDKKFRLNFSKQMSYPFLLDSTPADMFKFIAQSSGEDNLIEVLKQMKKDVAEISSNVKSHEEAQKVLGESLVHLEKRYSEIKDNRQYCEQVLSLDSTVKMYQDLMEKIEVYKKCTTALEKMNNSLNYFKGQYNDISSSVSVADSYMKRVQELESGVNRFYEYRTQGVQLELDLSKYRSVVERYAELDSVYENFRSQDANSVKLSSIQHDLIWLKHNKSYLTGYEGQREELLSSVDRYDKFISAIGKVLEIKDEKEATLSDLRSHIIDHDECEVNIDLMQQKVRLLQSDVDNISKEIEQIGVCPYCGSVLTGGSHEQHRD